MSQRMQPRLSVLVTGVGAPPGVSIFKAFRQSVLAPRLIAADADPASVGLFRADVARVLPHSGRDLTGYLASLETLIREERVSLVCFGSEVELLQVAPHARAIEQRTGARLVVNEPDLLGAFLDKWRTAQLLEQHGLPAPETVLARDERGVADLVARRGLPLIVKPRRGSGSRGVVVVDRPEDLDFFRRYVPDAVVQEYLAGDDQEYTVGLYQSRRLGFVGQIVFRRTMVAGLTYKATLVHDPEIESACRRVIEAFDVWGPINIQLRKTAAGIRIFEINPRFSSTAVMRAWFGFNEAEMCLRDQVLGERLPVPVIRDGRAFRYWDEVYVPDGPESGPEHLTGPRRGILLEDF